MTLAYIPQGPFLGENGRPTTAWIDWLLNPTLQSLGVVVPVSQGGTGITSYTAGDILYAATTTTFAALNAGPAGYTIVSNGPGVAPSYQAAGTGTVTHTLGPLTQYAVLIGNGGADAQALASLGTSGQVLTSNGAGVAPSFQPGGFANPMTTAGDIIVGGVAGVPARLPASTDGFVLTLSGGTPAWAAAAVGLTRGDMEARLTLASFL